MRLLNTLFLFSLINLEAIGQDDPEGKQVKEEIIKLYTDWNKARLKYDRQVLERLFACDYVWVHGLIIISLFLCQKK